MDNTAHFQIGGIEISGFFGLSPMAGFGDAAFRRVCRELGAGYTVSEMISAKALCHNDRKTREFLTSGGSPEAVQVFGNEPDYMAEGARIAVELSGAEILDINMGCPAKKIISSGDGSALMKNPELACGIIYAVKKAVSCPVTVKIRSGWDDGSKNAAEFAKMAEASGCDALCIHGRTAGQMYSGQADIALMARVVSAVSIPVIVNGDVTDAESGMSLLEKTGARFALVGRGALGNPWIFRELNAAAARNPAPPKPGLREKLGVFIHQTELAASDKGEKRACLEARAHFCHYLKGIKNAARYRNEATGVHSIDQIINLSERILSEAEENTLN